MVPSDTRRSFTGFQMITTVPMRPVEDERVRVTPHIQPLSVDQRMGYVGGIQNFLRRSEKI